jgi:hypothetical protein
MRKRQRPRQGGRSQDKKAISSRSLFLIRHHLNKFRECLCRLLCGKRLFNSDMSLELDRLQIEIDRRDDRDSLIRNGLQDLLRLLDS